MEPPAHTRLHGQPRSLAACVLAALAVLCLLAALARPDTTLGRTEGPMVTLPDGQRLAQRRDMDLYAAITARVAAGEDYYAAAADEQRRSAFPTVPVLAMRLPTLAWFNAILGLTGARIVMGLIAALTAWAWLRRLQRGEGRDAPFRPLFAGVVVLWSLAMVLYPSVVHSHEAWAGMLIALALALHDPVRPGAALAVGLAALLVRELALPFVLLMGGLALIGGRPREAGLWVVIVAIFGAALLAHARAHAAVVLPGDLHSPGWLTLPGLAGTTGKLVSSSLLTVVPDPLAAALVMLALAGWWAWDGLLGLTGALLHSGYALFFALFGRADNYYWGFMITPTLLLGLLVLPGLLRDLRAGPAPVRTAEIAR